jgi:hypothetical protein
LDVLSKDFSRILLVRSIESEGGRKPTPRHGKDFLFLLMPIKGDPSFHNALPAFTKELENLFRERTEELSGRIAEVITAKARLGKISDPIFPRYALYREHAPKIGEDFLDAFRNIIKPHCGVISDESRPMLYKLFSDRYRNIISQTESALKRLALSLGRKESDLESILAPARGIYTSSLSKYHNRLEAEILKHNLEVSVKPEVELRRQHSASKTKNADYKPKHKIVKDGVNKMLESLRIERPSATLDEAKHVYANQTGDSYSTVNKLYHYKAKK